MKRIYLSRMSGKLLPRIYRKKRQKADLCP
nr:MAG TPA: hypothetical protein [Caudoviricetes sp.]